MVSVRAQVARRYSSITIEWEYVSSQMILLASMKAEMKSRWPDEPLAAGKRALSRCNKKRDAYVMLSGKRVRCKA